MSSGARYPLNIKKRHPGKIKFRKVEKDNLVSAACWLKRTKMNYDPNRLKKNSYHLWDEMPKLLYIDSHRSSDSPQGSYQKGACINQMLIDVTI